MSYGESKATKPSAALFGKDKGQQQQQQQSVVSAAVDNDEINLLDDLAELLGGGGSPGGGGRSSSSGSSANREDDGMKESKFSITPSLLSQLQLPKETCATLFLEAINGFMFLVDGEGRCKVISDHVNSFLGDSAQAVMEGSSVYRFVHPGDHVRFSAALMQGKDGSLARPGGPDSFLKSRVFTCRFRRTDVEGAFEALQVSAVGIRPSADLVDGQDLSQCRLFCVARKVSLGERSQYFPVEMFTTKLDPNRNFRIVVVDTTGMNTIHASNISQSMLAKEMVNFCHPNDVGMLRGHLQTCVTEGADISAVYRLQVFDRPGEYVHVRTKSKLFRSPNPGSSLEDFVMATHSIIGESELRPADKPDHRANSGHQQQQFDPMNNNLIKQQHSSASSTASSSRTGGAPLTTDTLEKNLLLKQLLNVNFSREDGGGDSLKSNKPPSPPDVSNSRILQLLSQSTENVPPPPPSPPGHGAIADGFGSAVGVKRPATSSSSLGMDSGEPSPKSSSVCKQNPSLTNLLAKPAHNSSSVPPPVPTKWHQEPREKLPRGEDGLRKFLPPHPAERAAAAANLNADLLLQQPRSSNNVVSSSADNCLPQSPLLSSDMEPSDAMLSEILEGVIDFQEKSPSAAPITSTPMSLQQSAAEIEHIEKFLAGCTESGDFQSSSPVVGVTFSRSISAAPRLSGFTQSMPGSIPAASVASSTNNNRNNSLQQRLQGGGNPVNLVPRMSELLQVVPPNVTAPSPTDASVDLDSLVMLQQQQRRRSHSGGGHQMTPVSRQRVPSQPSSTANNLLMQQLNSAPLNRQGMYSGDGGYSFVGSQPMGGATAAGVRHPNMRLQYSPQQLQSPPPPMQQQQQMQGMQGPMMHSFMQRPKRPQLTPGGGGGGGGSDSDECRSLLQQLLSE